VGGVQGQVLDRDVPVEDPLGELVEGQVVGVGTGAEHRERVRAVQAQGCVEEAECLPDGGPAFGRRGIQPCRSVAEPSPLLVLALEAAGHLGAHRQRVLEAQRADVLR
jgi:hypothetical protein